MKFIKKKKREKFEVKMWKEKYILKQKTYKND